MVQDYPAAHSMDTDWFAVDAEGNIGYFCSAEGGAVPWVWRQAARETQIEVVRDFISFWSYALSSPIIELATSAESLPDLLRPKEVFHVIKQFQGDEEKIVATLLEKYRDLDEHEFWAIEDRVEEIIEFLISDEKPICNDDWVFEFVSNEALQTTLDRLDLLNPKHLNTDPGIYNFFSDERIAILKLANKPTVIIQRMWVEEHKQFFKNALVDGRITRFHLICLDEGYLHLLGLSDYTCGSGAPYPYELEIRPSHPLHVNEIPTALGKTCKTVQFKNLKFSETELIQPLEHMSCETWGTARWVDTQGNEREGHPYPLKPK
ncbi:MAG: hypothetical protein F6J87_10930 [Spirulina sp. SIO3F2]|nr:hypothetical protein [Spirulina sp. SIO3F2]